MNGLYKKIVAMREAGNVERCHVAPHIGSYTVGKHSYDAVSLLLLLHPDPTVRLIRAVQWHDSAERWVGDMPATAKWVNPELGTQYELCETSVMNKVDVVAGDLARLTDEERDWLNAVDKFELYMWCLDQEAFGNKHVQHFKANLEQWFDNVWTKIPEPVKEAYLTSYSSGFVRLPEMI